MGSPRVKEIIKELENLKRLESTKGYDFKLTKQRIENAGVSDLSMKRAINFRNNYIEEMKKYQNYENYDKLESLMGRYTNPLSFYKKLEGTDEQIADLTYQSWQILSQEEFNSFLNKLGIKTSDIQSTLEERHEIEMSAFDIKAKRLQERGEL